MKKAGLIALPFVNGTLYEKAPATPLEYIHSHYCRFMSFTRRIGGLIPPAFFATTP
ncbi:hypothetical protein ACFL0M_01785 [Thermodesulfobacteriota bacterium]